MKDVNKQNEYKEKDEIEAYFGDAKKSSFPIGLLFIIFIFLITGVCVYYYFIIDSPKNIFLTTLKDKFSEIKLDYTNTTKAIQNNKNLSNEQKQKQLIKAIKAKDEKIRILKRATTTDSQQIKNE